MWQCGKEELVEGVEGNKHHDSARQLSAQNGAHLCRGRQAQRVLVETQHGQGAYGQRHQRRARRKQAPRTHRRRTGPGTTVPSSDSIDKPLYLFCLWVLSSAKGEVFLFGCLAAQKGVLDAAACSCLRLTAALSVEGFIIARHMANYLSPAHS